MYGHVQLYHGTFSPSSIAFSTSDIALGLRGEDVVDLQSLGNHIATGYK